MTRKNGTNTEGRDTAGRFRPGNPGKPKGAKHRATQLAEEILKGGIEDVAKVVVERARDGDLVAARIVLDRILPPAKERPVLLALPDIASTEGVAEAQRCIVEAAASGEITPSEASTLSAIVEARRKALETQELETRIAALEAKK